jgi:hypothetical protein
MKTVVELKEITLMGKQHKIQKEFDEAICVYSTYATKTSGKFDDVHLELGEKVYNIKILETSSIIFTLTPESKDYLVTYFSQMFGFPSNEQISKIKELEILIENTQNEVLNIYKNIERAGFTDIK